jgi:4-amino-4-deoxy-L-arabinose transferase-like glycosyltransferase
VDFFSGYPPGQFYTIALVFRVFGSSLPVERIWDSVWRLAAAAAAFWLAREVGG